jgi:cobalt/nickel transport system permease protein
VEELKKPDESVYVIAEKVQEKTALMPGYDFRDKKEGSADKDAQQSSPAVSPGTSLSGIIGGAFTLALILAFGLFLRRRKAANPSGRH